MTPELKVLAYLALLQGLQLVLVALTVSKDIGVGNSLSARDPQKLGGSTQELVSPKTGRLMRALTNHFEALILYTIAVVLITLGDYGSGFTAICAYVFLASRILFLPAYYFGLSPWRSIIWFIGFLATFAMIGVSLFL